MRILALSSWWPEPSDNGSRLRIMYLLRALATEHDVHLVALCQQSSATVQREQIDSICASARAVPHTPRPLRQTDVLASLWHDQPASVRAAWNINFAATVQERAAAIQPDLVIAFQLAVAPYARCIPHVTRVLEEVEVTRILDQYRYERNPRQRMRSWLTWYKHRTYLADLLQDFDACTVVSQQEHSAVRAIAPQSMVMAIIPNGADVQKCAGDWGDPEPDTLIYPGSISYDANYDAMAYFLASSFPAIKAARPQVRLRITGTLDPASTMALPHPNGLELTGYVPDIRPVVARAWTEIVPLRKGGGTRLKVLEALALGTPVVSTAKGVEGLNLQHGQHVLLADTPDDFTATVLLLLSQPSLRARLSAAGKQIVRDQYDWRVFGQDLLDLLETITRPKQTSVYFERVVGG